METQQTTFRGEYRGIRYKVIIDEHPEYTGDRQWYFAEVVISSLQVPDKDDLKLLFPQGVVCYKQEGRPDVLFSQKWMFASAPDGARIKSVEHLYTGNDYPMISIIGWSYRTDDFPGLGYHDRANPGKVRKDIKRFIDDLKENYTIYEPCGWCGLYGDPIKERWVEPPQGYGKKLVDLACYEKLKERG